MNLEWVAGIIANDALMDINLKTKIEFDDLALIRKAIIDAIEENKNLIIKEII